MRARPLLIAVALLLAGWALLVGSTALYLDRQLEHQVDLSDHQLQLDRQPQRVALP